LYFAESDIDLRIKAMVLEILTKMTPTVSELVLVVLALFRMKKILPVRFNEQLHSTIDYINRMLNNTNTFIK